MYLPIKMYYLTLAGKKGTLAIYIYGWSPLAPFTLTRLFLLYFPVNFCLPSPSIQPHFPVYQVSIPRLQLFCFTSPTILLHFPDYITSPAWKSRILLLKNIRKYIFIFLTILDFFRIFISLFDLEIEDLLSSKKINACKKKRKI